MHESLGDRRKEVQEGARFIYFVKQLHNHLSQVRRLPQESLSHEPFTLKTLSNKLTKVTTWFIINLLRDRKVNATQAISIKNEREFINQNVLVWSDLKDHQKQSKRPTVAEIIL